jgi:hypothetical protein
MGLWSGFCENGVEEVWSRIGSMVGDVELFWCRDRLSSSSWVRGVACPVETNVCLVEHQDSYVSRHGG